MSLLKKLEEKLHKMPEEEISDEQALGAEASKEEQKAPEEEESVSVESEQELKKNNEEILNQVQDDNGSLPETEIGGKKKWEEIPESSTSKFKDWIAGSKKTLGIIAIVLLSFVFVMAVIVYVFRDSYFVRTYIFQEVFREKDVSIEIIAPKMITGGEEVEYMIKYYNTTKVDLEKITLSLIRPEDFKLTSQFDSGADVLVWDIGELKSRSEGRLEIKGIINAPKNAVRNLGVELKYKPINLGSFFTSKEDKEIMIEKTAVNLTLTVPPEVVIGRQIEYTIDCLNDGDASVSDLEVRVEYPEGFTFLSADPITFKEDDIWKINTLSKAEVYQISVKGVLNGKELEIMPLRVLIGRESAGEFEVFKEELLSSTLISSPLVLTQTVNNAEIYNANPGEILKFKIEYKNNTSLSINNIILKSIIDDKNGVLDLTTLQIGSGGKYDDNSKTITWQVSDTPSLAYLDTGAKGEVSFSAQVKSYLPINNFNDKNFVVLNNVLMTGANIPISIGTVEGSLAVKVNSKLILQGSGFYNDSIIMNSGPFPPKVGETTTYVVHWSLRNLANELVNVVIEGTLPGDVRWTGNTACKLGKLEYNEGTRKIKWNASILNIGTGLILPVEECVFQVEITPAPHQVGDEIILLKNIAASAKDSFTNVNLSGNIDNITTRNIQDAGDGQGVVTQ